MHVPAHRAVFYATGEPFNSLFEMRTPDGCPHEGILTFNSLFEMRQQADMQRANTLSDFQFSI